jgi:hypothetical protein
MQELYCHTCQKHRLHNVLVDKYGHECVVCHTVSDQLGRMQTESNTFLTPEGSEAVLVENTPDRAVFSIDEGKEAGYYVYDKKSGFGGVQKR